MKLTDSKGFWQIIDEWVQNGRIVIDRPRGTAHPRFPHFIYPLDYGYLENTASMDGGGINVWLGADPARRADAVMCIVDAMKGNSEIKILIGCTEEEKQLVYRVHNETEFMKGVLLEREK